MGWLTGLEPETREAFADLERYAQPSDIARAVEHSKAVSMAKANAYQATMYDAIINQTTALDNLTMQLQAAYDRSVGRR